AGRAEDAVAESLADHRCELDRLLRRRREPVDPRRDDAVKGCRNLERRGPLAKLPLALLVLCDRARVDERADGFFDEEWIASGARDDLVAKLVRHPIEGRVDDPRGLFVRKRLEDELAEVRSDWPRLGRSRSGALREEQKDGDARRARRDEPEKLERCRVGEMQVLEDVK